MRGRGVQRSGNKAAHCDEKSGVDRTLIISTNLSTYPHRTAKPVWIAKSVEAVRGAAGTHGRSSLVAAASGRERWPARGFASS